MQSMDAVTVLNSLQKLIEQKVAILQNILQSTNITGTTGLDEALQCFDALERQLHDGIQLEADLCRSSNTTKREMQANSGAASLAISIVSAYGSWHKPESFVRCFQSCLAQICRANANMHDDGLILVERALTTRFTTSLAGGRTDFDGHTSSVLDLHRSRSSDTFTTAEVLTFLHKVFQINPELNADDFFRKFVFPWLDAAVYADDETKLSIVNTTGRPDFLLRTQLMHLFPDHRTPSPETLLCIFRHRCLTEISKSFSKNLQIRLLTLLPVILVNKMMTAELFGTLICACKQSTVVAKQSISIMQNCVPYADENADFGARIASYFPVGCSTAQQRLSLLDSILVLLVSSQMHAVRSHLLSLKSSLSSSSRRVSAIEQLIWWRLFHHEHAHVRIWALRLFLGIEEKIWNFFESSAIEQQPSLFSLQDFFDGLNFIELGALVENMVENEETFDTVPVNNKSPSITVSSIVQHTVMLENRLKQFVLSMLTRNSAADTSSFVRNLSVLSRAAFGGERGRKWSFLSLTLLVRSILSSVKIFLATDRTQLINDDDLLCEFYQSVQLYFEMCSNWNLADRAYLVRFQPFSSVGQLFNVSKIENVAIKSSVMLALNSLCATRVTDCELLRRIIFQLYLPNAQSSSSLVYFAARKLRQIDSFAMFTVFTCFLKIPAPAIPVHKLIEFFRKPNAALTERLAAEFGRTLTFYRNFVTDVHADQRFLLAQYICWVCWMTCYDEDTVENSCVEDAAEENSDFFDALFAARNEFPAEMRLILLKIRQICAANTDSEMEKAVSFVMRCDELSDLRKFYTEAPQLALYIAHEHILSEHRRCKADVTRWCEKIAQIFCVDDENVITCTSYFDRFRWQQECMYFLPDDQLVMLKASRLVFFSLLRNSTPSTDDHDSKDTVCEQFCRTWFVRIGEFRDHVDFPRFLVCYAELLADAADSNCCTEEAIFELFCDACQMACCRTGLAHKMFEIFIFRANRRNDNHHKAFFERVLVCCLLHGGTASAGTESTKITLKNQFSSVIADTLHKYYPVEGFVGEEGDDFYQPEVYSDGHTRALALLFICSSINTKNEHFDVQKILLLLLEQNEAGSNSLAARRRQAIANSDEHFIQLRTWQAICAITTQFVAENCSNLKVFDEIELVCQTCLTNDSVCDNIHASVRVYMEFTWAVVGVSKLREKLREFERIECVQDWTDGKIVNSLLEKAKKARPRVAISLLHTLKLSLQLMLNDKIMPQQFQMFIRNVWFAPMRSKSVDNSSTLTTFPLYYFILCCVFEWFVASEQLFMRAHGVEVCLALIESFLPFATATGIDTKCKDHIFLLSQMQAILLSLKSEPNEKNLTRWMCHHFIPSNGPTTKPNLAALAYALTKPTKTVNAYEKVQLFRLSANENQSALLFWDNYFVDIPEKCGVDTREHIPSYVMLNTRKSLSRLSGDDDGNRLNSGIFGSKSNEQNTGAMFFTRLTSNAKTFDGMINSEQQQVAASMRPPAEAALFRQKKYRPSSAHVARADTSTEARPPALTTYTWSATHNFAREDNKTAQPDSANQGVNLKHPEGPLVHPQAEGAATQNFISTLPQSMSFYDVSPKQYDGSRRHGLQICVVATLLEKLPNLGGVCRTSEVLGVNELVIPNLKAITEHTFTVLSVGSEKWLKLTEVKRAGLAAFLTVKRLEGFVIIGLEQTDNSVLLQSKECTSILEQNHKFLLMLGAEETGLPGDILGHMDICVEIQQYGQIGSLNVHTAASIALWHFINVNSERSV